MGSRLALGTVQFGMAYGVSNTGGQTSMEEVARILKQARDAGIDTLDTAIAYGEAETVLGRVGVQDFRLVTKIPAVPEDISDIGGWVEDSVEQSFERLGVDRVSSILLHAPDQLFGPRGAQIASALTRLHEAGLTDKIGVSVYSCDMLERCLSVLPVGLAQLPMNVFDRELEHRAAEFRRAGVELHTRSAFLQGLLLQGARDRHPFFTPWAGLFETWEDWLARHGLSAQEACLRVALGCTDIERVVVGVESAAQLGELTDIAPQALPELPVWSQPIDATLINPAKWTLT